MATWFLLCVVQNSSILQRFRKEASLCLLPQSSLETPYVKLDVTRMRLSPFIQGLWKEALRLGSASAAARVVSRDVEVEGYLLRKGSVVLLPVQLMHFDARAFENAEDYEPERWVPASESSAEQQVECEQKLKRQNASLRSFGGGSGLCSGRFVAEQEILLTVATMLLLFDVELESDASDIQLSPRALGIMSPAREPKVKIRRRTVSPVTAE